MSTGDTDNTIPAPNSDEELHAIASALGAIDHIEKTLDLLRGKITLREYHYATMLTESLVKVMPNLHKGIICMEMGRLSDDLEDD